MYIVITIKCFYKACSEKQRSHHTNLAPSPKGNLYPFSYPILLVFLTNSLNRMHIYCHS